MVKIIKNKVVHVYWGETVDSLRDYISEKDNSTRAEFDRLCSEAARQMKIKIRPDVEFAESNSRRLYLADFLRMKGAIGYSLPSDSRRLIRWQRDSRYHVMLVGPIINGMSHS